MSGTSYTGFRLWQLRTAVRELVAAGAAPGRRAAAAVLSAGQIFWTANLAVLGTATVRLVRAARHRA